MAALLDNCKFNPTLGGTTDWTYSSAVSGYQSPTLAGAVTTRVYQCFALDASGNWEISQGACTITGGVPTFARTTVLYNSLGTGTAIGQSGAGTKISFAAAPSVAVVALTNNFQQYSAVVSVAAANTTYAVTQHGQLISRSNSGSPMVDTLPGTGTAILAAGTTINIANNDAAGLLAIKPAAGAAMVAQAASNGYVYLGPGQSISFYSDGAIYWAKDQPVRAKLQGATTIFVSASGSSTNDGLTSSTALPDPNVAYALAQSALDVNYKALTFSVAAGTYPAVLLNGPLLGVNANPTNGSNVTFLGNAATPANVIISTTTANNSWLMTSGAMAHVNGFTLANTVGHNFQLDEGSIALIENLSFTANGGGQNLIIASNNSIVYIIGNTTASAGTFNPGCVWLAAAGGSIQTFNLGATITFTFTGAVNWNTAFAATQYYSNIIINTPITITAASSTGKRYSASNGSTINTAGGGANFFPGNIAGTVGAFGTYI